MKPRLIALALIVVSAGAGYWFGSHAQQPMAITEVIHICAK